MLFRSVSDDSSDSDDQEEDPTMMTLSLVELRHIMSALVNEHIEVSAVKLFVVRIDFINYVLSRRGWSVE